MRKVSILIGICFLVAVMVASVAGQGQGGPGGGGGRGGGGGGGGQRGAPAGPPPPAGNGDKGAADLPGIMANLQAVGGGRGSLAGKITANDAAGVAADLATMATLFTSAQNAFNKEKVSGAADLAKAAADSATKASKAAKGGTIDAATTKQVQDSCGGCHTTYRTKDPTTNAYQLKKQ